LSKVVFDPSDPDLIEDPYPTLNALREEHRTFRTGGSPLLFVTRFADISSGLKNRSLGRVQDVEVQAATHDPRWSAFWEVERWSLLELEPPDHTRLRRLVSHAFLSRNVQRLAAPALEYASTLLQALCNQESFGLLGDFAKPFSISLITSLLGTPNSDGEELVRWSNEMVRMYELDTPDTEAATANNAAGAFAEYVRHHIRLKRANPSDDLLSALVSAEINGEHLTEAELVSTMIVLLNAGHEATVNTVGNGVTALLKHPAQWDRLTNGQVAASVGVEELLRFDAPLHLFERWVLQDTEVAGQELTTGAKVAFLFGSGQRDPRRFENPDTFDIGRGDTRHLAFGAGIHHCIGAPLARVELTAALQSLVTVTPNLVLTAEPIRTPGFVIRGYDEVVVSTTS
jgi:cytochrome P450